MLQSDFDPIRIDTKILDILFPLILQKMRRDNSRRGLKQAMGRQNKMENLRQLR